MATLSLRATATQEIMLRAVSGAVRNAQNAHPNWPFDDRFAKSIAKRAVGTLSALMPAVLASSGPSCEPDGHPANHRANRADIHGTARRGRSHRSGPSPLPDLHHKVGIMIRNARKSGNQEAWDALVEVARLIGKARAA